MQLELKASSSFDASIRDYVQRFAVQSQNYISTSRKILTLKRDFSLELESLRNDGQAKQVLAYNEITSIDLDTNERDIVITPKNSKKIVLTPLGNPMKTYCGLQKHYSLFQRKPLAEYNNIRITLDHTMLPQTLPSDQIRDGAEGDGGLNASQPIRSQLEYYPNIISLYQTFLVIRYNSDTLTGETAKRSGNKIFITRDVLRNFKEITRSDEVKQTVIDFPNIEALHREFDRLSFIMRDTGIVHTIIFDNENDITTCFNQLDGAFRALRLNISEPKRAASPFTDFSVTQKRADYQFDVLKLHDSKVILLDVTILVINKHLLEYWRPLGDKDPAKAQLVGQIDIQSCTEILRHTHDYYGFELLFPWRQSVSYIPKNPDDRDIIVSNIRFLLNDAHDTVQKDYYIATWPPLYYGIPSCVPNFSQFKVDGFSSSLASSSLNTLIGNDLDSSVVDEYVLEVCKRIMNLREQGNINQIQTLRRDLLDLLVNSRTLMNVGVVDLKILMTLLVTFNFVAAGFHRKEIVTFSMLLDRVTSLNLKSAAVFSAETLPDGRTDEDGDYLRLTGFLDERKTHAVNEAVYLEMVCHLELLVHGVSLLLENKALYKELAVPKRENFPILEDAIMQALDLLRFPDSFVSSLASRLLTALVQPPSSMDKRSERYDVQVKKNILGSQKIMIVQKVLETLSGKTRGNLEPKTEDENEIDELMTKKRLLERMTFHQPLNVLLAFVMDMKAFREVKELEGAIRGIEQTVRNNEVFAIVNLLSRSPSMATCFITTRLMNSLLLSEFAPFFRDKIFNYSTLIPFHLAHVLENKVRSKKLLREKTPLGETSESHRFLSLMLANNPGVCALFKRLIPRPLFKRIDSNDPDITKWDSHSWDKLFTLLVENKFKSPTEYWNHIALNELLEKLKQIDTSFTSTCQTSATSTRTRRQLRDATQTKWNHEEITMVYSHNDKKILIGKYFLQELIDDELDPPCLKVRLPRPIRFWTQLFERLLITKNPRVRIYILKTMNLVYYDYFLLIGPLTTLPYFLKTLIEELRNEKKSQSSPPDFTQKLVTKALVSQHAKRAGNDAGKPPETKEVEEKISATREMTVFLLIQLIFCSLFIDDDTIAHKNAEILIDNSGIIAFASIINVLVIELDAAISKFEPLENIRRDTVKHKPEVNRDSRQSHNFPKRTARSTTDKRAKGRKQTLWIGKSSARNYFGSGTVEDTMLFLSFPSDNPIRLIRHSIVLIVRTLHEIFTYPINAEEQAIDPLPKIKRMIYSPYVRWSLMNGFLVQKDDPELKLALLNLFGDIYITFQSLALGNFKSGGEEELLIELMAYSMEGVNITKSAEILRRWLNLKLEINSIHINVILHDNENVPQAPKLFHFAKLLPHQLADLFVRGNLDEFSEIFSAENYRSSSLIWNQNMRAHLHLLLDKGIQPYLAQVKGYIKGSSGILLDMESLDELSGFEFPTYETPIKETIRFPSSEDELKLGSIYLNVWVKKENRQTGLPANFDISQFRIQVEEEIVKKLDGKESLDALNVKELGELSLLLDALSKVMTSEKNAGTPMNAQISPLLDKIMLYSIDNYHRWRAEDFGGETLAKSKLIIKLTKTVSKIIASQCDVFIDNDTVTLINQVRKLVECIVSTAVDLNQSQTKRISFNELGIIKNFVSILPHYIVSMDFVVLLCRMLEIPLQFIQLVKRNLDFLSVEQNKYEPRRRATFVHPGSGPGSNIDVQIHEILDPSFGSVFDFYANVYRYYDKFVKPCHQAEKVLGYIMSTTIDYLQMKLINDRLKGPVFVQSGLFWRLLQFSLSFFISEHEVVDPIISISFDNVVNIITTNTLKSFQIVTEILKGSSKELMALLDKLLKGRLPRNLFQEKNDVVLRSLTKDVINPKFIWTVETRRELCDVISSQLASLDPISGSKDQSFEKQEKELVKNLAKHVFKSDENELIVRGIYVRLYNEDPTWIIQDTPAFIESLMTILMSETAKKAEIDQQEYLDRMCCGIVALENVLTYHGFHEILLDESYLKFIASFILVVDSENVFIDVTPNALAVLNSLSKSFNGAVKILEFSSLLARFFTLMKQATENEAVILQIIFMFKNIISNPTLIELVYKIGAFHFILEIVLDKDMVSSSVRQIAYECLCLGRQQFDPLNRLLEKYFSEPIVQDLFPLEPASGGTLNRFDSNREYPYWIWTDRIRQQILEKVKTTTATLETTWQEYVQNVLIDFVYLENINYMWDINDLDVPLTIDTTGLVKICDVFLSGYIRHHTDRLQLEFSIFIKTLLCATSARIAKLRDYNRRLAASQPNTGFVRKTYLQFPNEEAGERVFLLHLAAVLLATESIEFETYAYAAGSADELFTNLLTGLFELHHNYLFKRDLNLMFYQTAFMILTCSKLKIGELFVSDKLAGFVKANLMILEGKQKRSNEIVLQEEFLVLALILQAFLKYPMISKMFCNSSKIFLRMVESDQSPQLNTVLYNIIQILDQHFVNLGVSILSKENMSEDLINTISRQDPKNYVRRLWRNHDDLKQQKTLVQFNMKDITFPYLSDELFNHGIIIDLDNNTLPPANFAYSEGIQIMIKDSK